MSQNEIIDWDVNPQIKLTGSHLNDPIDLSIRILNQVVAMECDEALRRSRWCGRSKSRDLL